MPACKVGNSGGVVVLPPLGALPEDHRFSFEVLENLKRRNDFAGSRICVDVDPDAGSSAEADGAGA